VHDLVEFADLGVEVADEIPKDALLYLQSARIVILVVCPTVPGFRV
jgi:hypothetical protein